MNASSISDVDAYYELSSIIYLEGGLAKKIDVGI